jgi:hypothetical protein
MKSLILFLAIFLMIGLVSSLSFGVSPDRINLETQQNKDVCTNVKLIGENLVFSGEMKWSEGSSKDVNDYMINGKDIGISEKYPHRTGPGTYQICFESEKPGEFQGTLKYKIENSSYGIAIWINLLVEETEKTSLPEKITLLTGNVAKDIKEKSSELKNEILTGSLIFLIGFLGVLIFAKRK